MKNYDAIIIQAQLRINQRIDDQADVARAYFANYGRPSEKLEDYDFICNTLKRKGYDKYGDLFTRGFHCFEIVRHRKSQKLELVKYWTDVPSAKVFEINKSFVTGVIIAANYFERM